MDFSRLRHQPPGTQGQQGKLLQRQSDIIINLQDDWPDHQILYLLENVIPHPDVEPQFQAISEQIRSRPYVVDAKDGGLISRPRLWWQNIQWETAAHIVHQFTPWQIIQKFQHNTWHLHNPIAALLQPTFHTKDWETPTVLQEGKPFHCLTTQAPTDQGRPPPKSSHVDTSTWQRWEEHGRQFAPWQYMPQYLTRHQDGPWQPITPLQRERLMGFPDHYNLLTPTSPIDPETPCWETPGTDLDAISSFNLRTECQHTPRGPVHKPTEDDCHLEQLRSTMGSATTGTTTSLHATDGLDPPSPLGPTTPPKQPTTRSSGSNLTLGNTTTSPYPQHQRSQSQHRHRTPITCQRMGLTPLIHGSGIYQTTASEHTSNLR